MNDTPAEQNPPGQGTESEDARSAMSRPLPAKDLRRSAPVIRRIAAEPAEREAITEAFNLHGLDSLSLDAKLTPFGKDAWRLEGALKARGAQQCGVSLESAPFDLERRVIRLWSPSAEMRDPLADLDYDSQNPTGWSIDENDPDDGEVLEPLPEVVDLGAVALEAFSLALDPFPRAPTAAFDGAVFGPPGVEALTDETAKPFAGLAGLKDALRKNADSPDDDS